MLDKHDRSFYSIRANIYVTGCTSFLSFCLPYYLLASRVSDMDSLVVDGRERGKIVEEAGLAGGIYCFFLVLFCFV